MAVDTSEKDFEATIETALAGTGDHWAETGPAYGWESTPGGFVRRHYDKYDRVHCIDPEMLFDFLIASQPKTWERLRTQYGEQTKSRFLKRLVKEIEARGTLDVLRRGVTDLDCHFELAYFRPETSLNDEHRRLYHANIFSIMRQVHFSEKDEKSLDLVLFLNGLPIITAELKNPLKGQTVQNAVFQYRHDRDAKEPLFAFGRCLAHFAVDPDLVYMATHLHGPSTVFLPFNKGHQHGAGNPPNPDGFKTAYLWEQVWSRDSLLEIINHYLQQVDDLDDRGKKTGKRRLYFPRYHQLDAVRRLVAHARCHGAGQQYLIQHSAGSGKSNTIAWLAHRLSGLHDDQDARVFDSIIVITDRRVLDWQLQRTVRSFEQVAGVVTTIEKHKSVELAKALEGNKDIIVTTLQTFPFVAEKIGALPGKRFAVIIDEAHSSQSGEVNSHIKSVLTSGSLEEAEQVDSAPEPDVEDEINAVVETTMRQRGRQKNVSFFAFTATPKNKTMELFGQEGTDGVFRPFSLYSMRQAIEEKFILDVLKNYTTYKVYFSLLKRIEDDPQYDKKKATFLLRSYADLHEHAIRKKAEVMIEHFHGQVRDRIGKRAKAMVVTRSRLHAVRFKQAFDAYLKLKGYPYQALVAFSGEVTDPDSGLKFTEAGMNGFPDTQTAESFKGADVRFLIVANKFQTGFDQPLLHTMYVDKKLGGVNAVQTLSRLNRMHPDKDDTFVLDFANEVGEIQQAFQPYYTATMLAEATDPNKLNDLKRIVEDYGLFGSQDVEAFARVYFSKKGKQAQLQAILDPIADRYNERGADEQAQFRKHVGDYVRLYAFLSQVITFTSVTLEKFYQFTRHLLRKLAVPREELPVEITENINMDSYRIQLTSTGDVALLNEDGELQPIADLGTGRPRDEELITLSEIIKYINENYGADFTDADRVRYFAEDMRRRLDAQEGLQRALNPEINPSEETRKLAFETFFGDTLEDMIDANWDIYKKIKDDPNFGELFQAMMLKSFVAVLGQKSGHAGL